MRETVVVLRQTSAVISRLRVDTLAGQLAALSEPLGVLAAKSNFSTNARNARLVLRLQTSSLSVQPRWMQRAKSTLSCRGKEYRLSVGSVGFGTWGRWSRAGRHGLQFADRGGHRRHL
jgi:hypothetical protein